MFLANDSWNGGTCLFDPIQVSSFMQQIGILYAFYDAKRMRSLCDPGTTNSEAPVGSPKTLWDRPPKGRGS